MSFVPRSTGLDTLDEMPRQRSLSADSSPKDSPTTEDWDNSIETQAHRLARKMSNMNFEEDVNGNTASSPVIKSRPTPSETQFPVIIGGRSCFKTAADVQNFCQLPDPPLVNIAIETGINHQRPTYNSAPPQSGTHTIAYLSSASFRHIEDRSYNERISIWFKGELRNALLPLSIKPPPFFNPDSRRASAMKFKDKTRADDADALWEAAVLNQGLEKPEAPHGLVILGEGSMFKTAQEVADYFAWLDPPPVSEVLTVANTKRFTVCKISAADANTIQDVLLYKYIAVEFQGESINAVFPMTVSPAWQVTPKPPITLPGDAFATRFDTDRNSPRKAAPSKQDHSDKRVIIDNLTRPEGLYPLIIRKFPEEEDILNSSASSSSTIVHTWETTAYPQPKPAATRGFNRDPIMRSYPSTPIVYVTRDIHRKIEARGPGVNEVVWLKNHPMFAWRSFDYEFNLDWEQRVAQVAGESKDENDETVAGRSSLHRPEEYGRRSTDIVATPSTIGWPRTERNPSDCAEPIGLGKSSRANDGQSPSETTVAGIRRNKKTLRSTKEIDTFVAAGPHTGTDTIDWAERTGTDHSRVHSEAREVSEVSDEVRDEVRDGVSEEVEVEGKNFTDEKSKKSGSFRSGIKKLLGFGKRD